MWIKRDFYDFISHLNPQQLLPVKVLKGPRQVGKTSLLSEFSDFKLIQLDDLATRHQANENPRLFLEQFHLEDGRGLILDEATLAPNLFLELKRRVDDARIKNRKGSVAPSMNVWITGSNQTLLEKSVQESLAGRASYFDLNTLSIHEIGKFNLQELILKGGWPELHVQPQLSVTSYLNDLISTFIEKDIVAAAGIERRSAFIKSMGLVAGRIGQLINYSDISKIVGVDSTTLNSWVGKMEQNALVRIIPSFSSNLNQRLIKSPKIYFEDVGLACRFQGWTDFQPLFFSPSFGHIVENLILIQILRFFQNMGQKPSVFFLRSKEKVEIDFLVELPNNRWLAVEAKTQVSSFSQKQLDLLETCQLNIVDKWIVNVTQESENLSHSQNGKNIHVKDVHAELLKIWKS
jgi:predicted AAA+ superfamily ATPase